MTCGKGEMKNDYVSEARFDGVDDFTANHSQPDITVEQLAWVACATGQGIYVNHSMVCPRPGRHHAGLFLPKRRVSRPRRVSAYSLFRRHPLFGMPAVRGLQLLVAPRDCRVQAIEDVVIRSDQIGIEDQSRSIAAQRAPRVSAFDALRPQTIFRPGFVLRAMRRLH